MPLQLRNFSPTYKWPVLVEPPEGGGKYGKETFDAEFRRLPQDQLREIGDRIEAGTITDLELLDKVLLGWSGIFDEAGDEVPYSETNAGEILNVALVASAIVAAWLESLAKGKRKN
jgi:hypothetical protein